MFASLTKKPKLDKFEQNQDERIATDLINDIDSFFKKEKIPEDKIEEVITQLVDKLRNYDVNFALVFINILKKSDIAKKHNLKL